MFLCRNEGRDEVVFGQHVGDGVVDQNAVEFPAQPNGPHISQMVVDSGIQAPLQVQHFGGNVDRSGLKFAGQVGKVMPAAHTQ